MRQMFTLSIGSFFLMPLAGCAIAQQFALPAISITAEVRVFDPEKHPVEGATVNITFPRYQIGDQPRENYQSVDAQTDKEGLAVLSGTAQADYVVSVTKQGYYRTQGPRGVLNTETGLKKYGVGLQKIDLELRPKIYPILGIQKGVDRWPLPRTDGTPLGFDLEVGDWVAPFGKGKSSDFIFTVGGYFNSLNDFNDSLTLNFSNRGDGIIPFMHPRDVGSALRWPYEAPLDGYESQRVWRRFSNGETHTVSRDKSGELNYLFRVRTELDERGKVRRAMYGVISYEVVFGGNNEIGRNLSFTYALNPDWTRNLEFDPEKSASSPR